MNQIAVEFDQITKAYAETVVVSDLTVAIPAAVTTALVGESGSGKSTLLQLINGLVRPDAGEVRIFGEALDYARLPETRTRMGYAVQGAGLFPHLTVSGNITLVARQRGWPESRIEERFLTLMNLLELPEDFRDRYPHSLSGGQQQRVSLCRAMMLDPPLMLLDEPFSALDPITRRSIHEEFLRLQALGPRTTVLVTHDLAEAEKLADWLIILRDGEIVQCGELSAVRESPADDYVRRLLEESR